MTDAELQNLYDDLREEMAQVNIVAPDPDGGWRNHRVVACTLEKWRKFWRDRGIG